MGNVVGSLLGTSRLTRRTDQFEGVARGYAEEAKFRPYTVTTGAGTTGYQDGRFFSELSQPYQDIQASTLGGALGLFEQAAAFDPRAREQEVFAQQAALLQPQFEQQATALQSRLFGGGRLGLRLAGESQGLGAGSGMVNPDALGLGQAQQQTLAQLAANARTQAFGEQAQLGQFAQGLLGAGTQISELERALMAQGVDAETARSNAAAMAGSLATGQYGNAVTAQAAAQRNQQNLISGAAGGFSGGGMLGGLFGGSSNSFVDPMNQMSGNSVFENTSQFGRVYYD